MYSLHLQRSMCRYPLSASLLGINVPNNGQFTVGDKTFTDRESKG